MWNYAKLSKLAKIFGTPEKLVQFLIDMGIKKGRLQMIPFVIAAFALGIALIPLINYFKAKRVQSAQEFEEAKQMLIKGIEDYDAAQLKEE